MIPESALVGAAQQPGRSAPHSWSTTTPGAAASVSALWISVRATSTCSAAIAFGDNISYQHVHRASDIEAAISSRQPTVLCFDFDSPQWRDLTVIRTIKAKYPSIPILMLVDRHAPDLVLWALRARVWDYLIKPVHADDLLERIRLISTLRAAGPDYHLTPLPEPDFVPAAREGKAPVLARTQPAVDLVREHYSQRLHIADAARRCQMSSFHFCRLFKREHGITFHEFVIARRMTQASHLLQTTTFPIKAIALSVGFSDVPHFTRTFRRLRGVSPARFRSSTRSTG